MFYYITNAEIAIRFSDRDYYATESSQQMVVEVELIRGTSSTPVGFTITLSGQTARGECTNN